MMKLLNSYYSVFGMEVTNPTRFIVMTVLASIVGGIVSGAIAALEPKA